MLSQKIKDFASTISFTVKEDSAYGFIHDFLISIYETGTKKCFYVYYSMDDIASDSDSPVSIMNVSKSLREVFAKYNVTNYSLNEDGLEVLCNLPFKEFYTLMKETSKELDQFKAIKKDVCFNCGKKISSKVKHFRLSKNCKNHIVCTSCKNDFIKNPSQIQEDNETEASENKGSATKGILGALLFGFGITLCFVLLYAFVIPLPDFKSGFKPGYYVNWIMSAMPIAVIFGYRIFAKESLSIQKFFVCSGISLFLAIVSQYVASVVLFARESVLTFENLPAERFMKMIPSLLKVPFTDSYTSPDFKIYLIMDTIFVILSLMVYNFLTAPKTEAETIIEEL